MSPETLNIVLLIIILIFIANGFYQGFLHMLGSLLGLVVGVFLGGHYNASLGLWLANLTGWDRNVMTVVAFVLIVLATARLFGIVVHIFEKTFRLMKIPLFGLANRLVGAVIGFFEGIFITGSTLIIMSSLPFLGFDQLVAASTLAASLIAASKIILPLLPKALSDLYR